MNLTTIATTNNLQRLSITLSLFVSLPLTVIPSQPLLAQTILAQNQSIQDNSPYNQIIYVDPRSGNDQNGQGNQNSPFKTITQALMIAKPKSLIMLNSGTYNEQSGETFPLILTNQVTIQGNPKLQGRNINIEGSGFFLSRTAAGQNVTIAAIDKAGGIMGVTVTNPHNRGHGIWIESANPIISGNTLIRNGNTGVSVNGNSAPTISNNYFFNNGGNGLLVYGTSKARVENNEFHRTGYGISGVQNSALVLIGNTFRDNRIGVILEGNSVASLRNNTIISSTEIGLMTISQARADLGHGKEAGGNIFRSNHQLDLKNSSVNQVITAFGNQIKGKTAGNIDFQGNIAQVNVDSPAHNLNTSPPLPALTNHNSPQTVSPSFPPSPPTGRVIEVTAPTANNTSSLSPSPVPLNNNSSETLGNSNGSMPPLPTKQPATEVIRINGSPTPVSPISSGKTTTSNRSLPTPPELSQPYRQNNDHNLNPPSQTALGPLDPPPNHHKPEPVTSPVPTSYGNSNQKRQSLADILVVAPGASNATPPPSLTPSNPNNSNYTAYNSNDHSSVYKVVVEAKYGYQESKIRSLYPDAFRTNYNGRSMLQVGVFSSRQRAEQVLQSLRSVGLSPLMIP